ncbi:MAG: amidohydrolase family protein [Reichenbachiella sp.]
MYSLKSLLFSLLSLLFITSSVCGQTICIENVNVIPMDRDTILMNHMVVIRDQKILMIQPADSGSSTAYDQIIDGTNKYLMPGLVEMHYHLRNNIENEFKLLIANGITTARNMAEFHGQDHITIRTKQRKGELFGPDYYTAGPYLKASELQHKTDVIKTVTEHKRKGYDYLKLADNLDEEVYLFLLEETSKNNITLVGHGQHHLPLEYSLRMKSIEHVEEFMYILSDEEKENTQTLNQIAKQVKASGTFVAPTLGVFEMISRYADDDKFDQLKSSPELKYLPNEYLEHWTSDNFNYRTNQWFRSEESLKRLAKEEQWLRTMTKILFDNGVSLIAGSDPYGLSLAGFSLHHELELINSTGISPFETLRAATVNAARYLDNLTMKGTVTKGKYADLMLLSKNPLDNISNTQSIEGVMLKGEWMDRIELNQMLKEVEMDCQ